MTPERKDALADIAFALFDIGMTLAITGLVVAGFVYMFRALAADNWIGGVTSVAVVFVGQAYLYWRVRHPLSG